MTDLGCPHPANERNVLTDWLLGYAIRLDYGDEGTCKYRSHVKLQMITQITI